MNENKEPNPHGPPLRRFIDPAYVPLAKDLAEVRERIDAIDVQIVTLLAELGGREVGDTDHMVTETLIRGMYKYWREVMEA